LNHRNEFGFGFELLTYGFADLFGVAPCILTFEFELTHGSELRFVPQLYGVGLVEYFWRDVDAVEPRDSGAIDEKSLEVRFALQRLEYGPLSHGAKSITFIVPSLNFTSIR
jgi:hypothetical protein